MLAKQYEKNFDPQLLTMNSMPLLLPLATAMVMEDETRYNSPITYSELIRAVENLNNSAPGFDLIHNLMIKNLPQESLVHLLRIFNASFDTGYIPLTWKKAIIIPILKPYKDKTNVESY